MPVPIRVRIGVKAARAIVHRVLSEKKNGVDARSDEDAELRRWVEQTLAPALQRQEGP